MQFRSFLPPMPAHNKEQVGTHVPWHLFILVVYQFDFPPSASRLFYHPLSVCIYLERKIIGQLECT